MSIRRLPLHPNLDQLRHQAKDLLRQIRRGDPAAIAELRRVSPRVRRAWQRRLADAQHVLAQLRGTELAAPRARLPVDRRDLER